MDSRKVDDFNPAKGRGGAMNDSDVMCSFKQLRPCPCGTGKE